MADQKNPVVLTPKANPAEPTMQNQPPESIPQAQPSGNGKKKRWIKWIMIGVGVFVGLGIIGSFIPESALEPSNKGEGKAYTLACSKFQMQEYYEANVIGSDPQNCIITFRRASGEGGEGPDVIVALNPVPAYWDQPNSLKEAQDIYFENRPKAKDLISKSEETTIDGAPALKINYLFEKGSTREGILYLIYYEKGFPLVDNAGKEVRSKFFNINFSYDEDKAQNEKGAANIIKSWSWQSEEDFKSFQEARGG